MTHLSSINFETTSQTFDFLFCLFWRKMTKIFSTPWRWQEFSEKWQILQKLAKNMSHLAINQTYSHSKCPFWRIVPKSFWSRISDPPSGYSRFLPVTASIQSSDTWARPRSNLAADWKQKWLKAFQTATLFGLIDSGRFFIHIS